MKREAGILCPMFSVPGNQGIGDFGTKTLKMIDCIADAGDKVWQMLPLQVTGFTHSPYQNLSSFAGDPIYINIDRLSEMGLVTQSSVINCNKFKNHVDYVLVREFKEKYFAVFCWRVFVHFTKEDNTRSASFNWSEVNALLGEVSLIEIMSYYDNGYVKEVLVNETYYSGREIREMFQLSSSAFQIVQNEEGLVFETVGSGHGVGMSQYGAFGMALEGYNYQEILKHYYQGAEIAGL